MPIARLLTLLLLCANAIGWSQASHQVLAITHVTVINPSESSPKLDVTVLIVGKKIVSVGSSAQIKVAPDAVVLDGSGKFLIPGLWDMHVHTDRPERDFPLFVANGVLGVRNMAGVAKEVFQWRADTASGKMIGPRIVACGPLVDGPEPAHPEHAIAVRNVSEGRQAVRSLKSMGADFVKVYDGVPRDAYFAIADEAKKLGLPFVGHVPLSIGVREASNAGQHSIEHGAVLQGGSTFEDEYIRLETTGPDVMQEAVRTHNFSLIPANIAKNGTALLDHLRRERLIELYKTFVKNGTYLTPTLIVKRARTFVDSVSKRQDPRMVYVSASERKAWKPENDIFAKYRTPDYIAYQKREYAETLKALRLAQNLGVQLLAGTDVVAPYTYPGFSLHDELGLLVEAGLTPLEALRTATTNPVSFLNISDAGAIAAGMRADVVLLEANPIVDITNTRKISAIILRGTLYRRSQLHDLLSKAAKVASSQAQ